MCDFQKMIETVSLELLSQSAVYEGPDAMKRIEADHGKTKMNFSFEQKRFGVWN